jgi:hypothetical protein
MHDGVQLIAVVVRLAHASHHCSHQDAVHSYSFAISTHWMLAFAKVGKQLSGIRDKLTILQATHEAAIEIIIINRSDE